ncbi:MAG: dienelactone hydrolase family protein, partial [Dehalococcoidia bacterium]|nr:dienelactone hydrolase family protein [Dehalococcoidia bacterium]
MYEGMIAESILLRGDKGDRIAGYLARPLGPGPFGGVVVIHHAPGYDESSKEICRKFAYHGFIALCPNLHYRENPTDPAAAALASRAAGGVPDARCMGDVRGAMDYMRSLTSCNGKIGVIGYCSGGRQVYLSACNIPDLSAAVNCYGGSVIMPPDRLSVNQPVAPIDLTANIGCPLLGLFGVEDRNPTQEDVRQIEEELKRFGKTYEFHSYENAGHSFFSIDRPAYRV